MRAVSVLAAVWMVGCGGGGEPGATSSAADGVQPAACVLPQGASVALVSDNCLPVAPGAGGCAENYECTGPVEGTAVGPATGPGCVATDVQVRPDDHMSVTWTTCTTSMCVRTSQNDWKCAGGTSAYSCDGVSPPSGCVAKGPIYAGAEATAYCCP